MFEIKITVEMPDLVKAVQIFKDSVDVSAGQRGSELVALLDVLKQEGSSCCSCDYKDPGPVVQPQPATVTPAAAMPAEAQVVPTTVTAPAPAPAPAPAATPAVAPTAAPAFTLAQVARAGAQLLTAKPALQNDLMALLGRYGAKTAQDLPQDRLGEFAAELRQMGAQI